MWTDDFTSTISGSQKLCVPTLLMTASQFKISPHPDPHTPLPAQHWNTYYCHIYCAPLCATSGLQQSVKCRVGSWISDVTTPEVSVHKEQLWRQMWARARAWCLCVCGDGECALCFSFFFIQIQFYCVYAPALACRRRRHKTSLNVAHNILIISIK